MASPVLERGSCVHSPAGAHYAVAATYSRIGFPSKHSALAGSVFEPEDGYMLGSYVVNLGLTAIVGVLFAFFFVFGTDLSVTTVQISAVALVIGFPILMYGHAQLFWICIDLLFSSSKKFDPNRVRHS